jgi:hypothetical protein
MQSIKKTLLIFFGELRTFEYVIPHLKDLDKVDVILSTWKTSRRYDTEFIVDENLIYQILPNIKQYHIVNPDHIPDFNLKCPSWKMYWHWKNAINNIPNPNEYENVILHRTDIVTNWYIILNLNIKKNTLYCHHGSLTNPHFKKGDYNLKKEGVWVNDYYLFGKFEFIKQFVNSLNKENYPTPHIGIWEAIVENNIKFNQFVLMGRLVRDYDIESLHLSNGIDYRLLKFSGPGIGVKSKNSFE